MLGSISRFIDRVSNYLAHRKGLLPFLGLVLILINLVFQFVPALQPLAQKNILLHLGLMVAILGLMLAWAL